MKSTDRLTVLAGVGEKTAALFSNLGIDRISDMLSYYPKDYECYEEPETVSSAWKTFAKFMSQTDGISDVNEQKQLKNRLGKKSIVTIYGKVSETVKLAKKGALTIAIGTAYDIYNNKFQMIWYNMPYIRSNVKAGECYVFRGRISMRSRKVLELEQPEVIRKEKYDSLSGRLIPIYPLTKGISRNLFLKCMQQILENMPLIGYNKDVFLPEKIAEKYDLWDWEHAIGQIHFPKNMETMQQARKSLVFEEFFRFALFMQFMKNGYGKRPNQYPRLKTSTEVDELVANLPYDLTKAQKRVWKEMRDDLTGAYTMHRLVQGDVGSGKTILAYLALYETALSGYQGFFMAPTEVLAQQHFLGLQKLFDDHGIDIPIGFLSGSLTASEKRKIQERIRNKEVLIVIGTHALFQDSVEASDLALVITDEQHRFGVDQREQLKNKGIQPHICVMSATPIPRTLGMILYGDLDISVLDEKPAKRLPIKSCVVDTSYRKNAYQFIQKQIVEGHQVYVVCPMIEESELMAGENVLDYADTLRTVLPKDMTVEVLHGRMTPQQKNEIMQRFQEGQTKVLVSTVVIEVGVDVPNATVMMIEDAQRFGLAQLHQLRGRVGRGTAQSYCIFVQTDEDTKENARLKILNNSEDGFEIAEEDLKLRGPGELTGTRQSGGLTFALGDIYSDLHLFQNAAIEAAEYVNGLSVDENSRLEERLKAAMEAVGMDKILL